jgi:glycosyltransferase involved in cell wall biosynthesis
MRFSILIPTYNRTESLLQVLNSINNQEFSKNRFEVIIIDDGGTDNAGNMVEKFKNTNNLNIKYFLKNHEGPAAARNFGIEKAEGEIILFTGDDAIFGQNMLEKHDRVHHRQKNVAVLGFTEWNPSLEISDFMRYIAPFGVQFHYHTIKDVNDAGWDHLYTINASVPRSLIGDSRFDTRFIYAAFEDHDFCLALTKKGMKVVFEKDAVVYHNHYYEPEVFYNRMIKTGKSALIFIDKYKHDKAICRNLKWRYNPFGFVPGLFPMSRFFSGVLSRSKLIKKLKPEFHWFLNMYHHYSLGITEASKQK